MRIELSWKGVGKNRVYFATLATAGRPRKSDAIVKSRKTFAVGSTRDEAIQVLKDMVGFKPADAKTV